MTERIRVAVKSNDICLRNPKDQRRLTTEGTVVVKDSFWLRRLKAGDCIRLPLELKRPQELERNDDGDTI